MNRYKVIATKATPYLDRLADYHVTREQIDKLLALIDEYKVMPDIRDNVKSAKKSGRADIKKVISAICDRFDIPTI